MKKRNILVIGGTGFIGRHLIKKCLKKSYNITCISSKKISDKTAFKKVNYLICDIRNKKKLQDLLKKKIHYVINLGGYVDHSNKKKTLGSHYYGCKNLVDIFLNKKIVHFVQLGSGLEHGDIKSPQKESNICNPKSTYSLAKYMASRYLLKQHKKNNFPCTVLRLYQAYGPWQKSNRLIPMVIESCLNKEEFPCTSGNQIRDFLYIDDLISLILKVLSNKKTFGKIINAGSGKAIKIKNLIKKIKKISGGGIPKYGKLKMRKDETKNMYPSINTAKNLLNWKPKYSIETGLVKTVNSYREK